MVRERLRRLVMGSAPQTLGLRIGIVGANFGVMVGLAWLLGLAAFGQLTFLWGGAMLAGTILSLGGPLILLRALTDGSGLRSSDIFGYCIIYPGLMAAALLGPLTWSFPDLPWEAILIAGLSINLSFCLASVMRALGSVQWSMALRDAGPQISLGLAAFIAAGTGGEFMMTLAAFVMAAISVLVALWCWRHSRLSSILTPTARPIWSPALYGTGVLGMGLTQMDLIIGGAALSGEAFGLYALLRRVANLVALPVTVATWVSAAPISSAHGQGDLPGLSKASAAGSQIALYPGAVLFVLGLLALPLVSFAASGGLEIAAMTVFAILLCGAMGQVIFASSYTVSTLCGLAQYSVVARVCVIAVYLVATQFIGDDLTIISNAAAYVIALTTGAIGLWWGIRRRLEVDTSALVLFGRKASAWQAS